MIYDIPIRTGRKIATEVLVRLANDVPNVLGVKDAAGNPGETSRLVAAAPESFEVYSGDDINTLPLVAVGAVGVVSVAGHWVAPDLVEFFDAWERGDTATARRVNARLLESYAFETGDEAPNPMPSKAMLRHLGQPAGRCRPPLGPDPEWLEPASGRGVQPVGRRPWLTRPLGAGTARPGATPSASSSSAAWARSAATAWRSSSAAARRATDRTGRSCSSTAG